LRVTTNMSSTNDNAAPNAKCPHYLKITSDQLSQLIIGPSPCCFVKHT
jgi:hypothetical protein